MPVTQIRLSAQLIWVNLLRAILCHREGMTDPQTSLRWLGLEAPRYTSYPTAHHFSASVGAAQARSWVSQVGAGEGVSVYVHVPFCRELCWFCGCHTKMTKRYEPIAKYVQTLLQEIALIKAQLGGRGILRNIHFGGGSPSMLTAEDLGAILEAIRGAFAQVRIHEQAIELDPRTTTSENIAYYRAMGFNRISIGLQDFAPEVQEAINRVQPYAQVAEVVAGLRAASFDNLNCDLIYGLPHQTLARFMDSLEKTMTLAPERIALFSYAHVPDIKKHQRLIDTAWLPKDGEKLELFMRGVAFLEGQGYSTIGIDHFAKPTDSLASAHAAGTLRRNFQGYVTDGSDVLIGVGCSSISQYPGGYAQNSARLPEYAARIEAGELGTTRGVAFTGDDVARKHVIDTLMCFLSVDLAAIRAEHDLPEGYFNAEIEALRAPQFADIVAIEGERLTIISEYRMAARVIAAQFDAYRHVIAGRFSKVV